jgi:hypothetical protein
MTAGNADEYSEATLAPEQAEPQNNGHVYHSPALPSSLRAVMHRLREDWQNDRFHAIAAATYRLHREGGDAYRDCIAVWADARGMKEEFVAEAMAYGTKQWVEHKKEPEPPPKQMNSIIPPPVQAAVFKSSRANTVEMRPLTWLWPDRFAIGKLGLIAGLPDEGKGQIFCDMAARVTRGNVWPCGEGRAPLGNVIHMSAEDDPADTIVPRLTAAGADLSRIELMSMVQDKGKDRMFSLITDLPLLRQKIIEVGDVRMVQIDPISAYLGVGKVDSYRTTDVRAVLAPLVDLALEMRVSIVGIMHFNKKLDVMNALLRISDSLAFGATARHAFAAVDDPHNRRKLFIRGKNNLARKDLKALAYNFGIKEVQDGIWAPYIDWHLEHVDVTATEDASRNE